MNAGHRGDDVRGQIPDLLTRPPSSTGALASEWSHMIIDPVRQLEVLADLFTMGLLSRQEYERYKGQIGSH
jgi:hypothetical protein